MKKALWLLVLLLGTAAGQAQQLRTLKDVVYGKIGERELTLDAYLWDGATLAPAVVYIHGGGWRNGDKSRLPDFLQEALFKSGISLISISYRLSGEAVHPAQVRDVTRAIQFVKHNASPWHIQKDRIAVMGGSAGAHLALWIGLHPDLARPHSGDPVERESTRVAAIVNYYGPTNFHLLKTMEHGHPAYREVFGFKPGTPASRIGDERLTMFSPITYVSPDDPPVFTYHGKADQTVPIVHAEQLIAKLKENGVVVENYLVEKAGHGLGNANPDGPDFKSATVEFLKKHLGR